MSKSKLSFLVAGLIGIISIADAAVPFSSIGFNIQNNTSNPIIASQPSLQNATFKCNGASTLSNLPANRGLSCALSPVVEGLNFYSIRFVYKYGPLAPNRCVFKISKVTILGQTSWSARYEGSPNHCGYAESKKQHTVNFSVN